jgi:ankyrin repeat protein
MGGKDADDDESSVRMVDAAETLAKRGARVDNLIAAAALGRVAHGIDPTVSDNHGMTGLDWASANGHANIVKLLTERRG